MPIIGARFSHTHLQRPQVVFAPSTPTLRQQTIIIAYGQTVSRRITEKRRFPLPGFTSQLVRETGYTAASPTTNTQFIQALTKPLLGPHPPTVLGPPPPQRMQTVTVVYQQAVANRAYRVRRGYPAVIGGSRQRLVRQTGSAAAINLQHLDPLIGPRPPTIVLPLPTSDQTNLNVFFTRAIQNRLSRTRRAPHSDLPVVVPTVTGFIAPPLSINCLQPDRLSRRHRRIPPVPIGGIIFPPIALQIFSGPQINQVLIDRLGRSKRRRQQPSSVLFPPAVVEPSLQLPDRRLEIPINLVRNRPLPITYLIGEPTTLQTFAGPQVNLLPVDRIGRRQRRHNLTSFLQPPFFYAQTSEIVVTLVKIRPKATTNNLPGPIVLQVFDGSSTWLVRTRPQRTGFKLAPPIVVTTTGQIFYGPDAILARVRPSKTIHQLGSLIFYAQTSEILVNFVRTRPRPKQVFLGKPAVLQTFTGPSVSLARARPRRPLSTLRTPNVVRVPSIEQHQQTIQVALVRARPRPTITRISEPTTLQIFAGASVHLTQIRPRPTRKLLAAPTVVRVPSVEQAEQTIRTSLTRTRPRPTSKSLGDPIVLQTFDGPLVVLARIRPHPTTKKLAPPTVVVAAVVFLGPRIISTAVARSQRPVPTTGQVGSPLIIDPLPGQTQQTVQTTLAAITNRLHGARSPHSHLASPTTTQIFAGPIVSLIRVRPYPTTKYLVPPTVVLVPSVEQDEQTIKVHLVRIRPRPIASRINPPAELQVFAGPFVSLVHTRPRPTSKTIFAPAVLRVASVEQQLRTVGIKLVNTRPRPTVKDLRPPTVINASPPVVTTIDVSDAVLKTRIEQKRHFPLQGFRQRLVRITGSTLTFPSFDPLLGPRPPQIIDPLPSLEAQTINASFSIAVQNRLHRRKRGLPDIGGGQRQRLVRQTGAAATLNLQHRDPLIGVRPPMIVGGLPTGDQTALSVNFQGFKRRLREKRYFPLQGFTGQLIRETGQGVSVIQSAFKPLLGVRPPTIIGPLPNDQQQAITTRSVAVRTLVEQRRHEPRSVLSPPAFVTPTPPSQDQQIIRVELVAARTAVEQQRHAPRSRQINPFFYDATSTISVTNVAVQTRIGFQRRAAHYFLTSISYPATSEIVINLAAIRTQNEAQRRAPKFFLSNPTVLRVPSVEQQQQTIKVATVQIRPRHTSRFLSGPTTLQTFSGPLVVLTKTRPRPTTHKLFAPTALQTFIQPIRSLARIRPRPTTNYIQPPATLQIFSGPIVTLTRIRPRPTIKVLTPPQVVNYNPVDLTILVSLAGRTRIEQQRRGAHSSLTSISYRTISRILVSLTRIRPRPTTTFLEPPVFVNVFQARKTVVTLTVIRPRPTAKSLGEPTILRVPSVEQLQETIRVSLVRTRPQPTTTQVQAPAFTPPLVTKLFGAQVHIRPLPTIRHLQAPTAVHRFKIGRGRVVPTFSESGSVAQAGRSTVTATIKSKLVESQQSGSDVDIGTQEGTVIHE